MRGAWSVGEIATAVNGTDSLMADTQSTAVLRQLGKSCVHKSSIVTDRYANHALRTVTAHRARAARRWSVRGCETGGFLSPVNVNELAISGSGLSDLVS